MSLHKCCLVKDEDYGWYCEDCNKQYTVINDDDLDEYNDHECRMWKDDDDNDDSWQCENSNCDIVLYFKSKNK